MRKLIKLDKIYDIKFDSKIHSFLSPEHIYIPIETGFDLLKKQYSKVLMGEAILENKLKKIKSSISGKVIGTSKLICDGVEKECIVIENNYEEDSKEVKNIIVFDLEWNQSSFHTNHRIPHEIIEIGACRVSREGSVLDRFSRLIRPRVYQKLDKHIKQVTGITEEELANGKPFSDVFGDFIAWCGEDVQLVTWGRDDYPVLKRNAAFFMTPMPFEPPMDAQLIFGFCCLGGAHQQMNLHAAMEKMEIELDAPAHRAVYDAECTAALLGKIDEALCVLPPERRMQLEATLEKEKRISASAISPGTAVRLTCCFLTDARCSRMFALKRSPHSSAFLPVPTNSFLPKPISFPRPLTRISKRWIPRSSARIRFPIPPRRSICK